MNDRFLARVFHAPHAPWVLKGGTAVLARVDDARTTKDVDLLGELDDIDVALGRLRSAAAVDLGDHFRFIITGHDRTVFGTGQPHADGYRVHVDAYCGAVKRHTFGVDLVTGSLMTTAPDVQTPTPALNLRGLIPPTLRLYPVVDHIADKLCATQSTYGAAGDRPSSRVRDLVDLVVFARSQDVDGDALINAIRARWNHQGLAGDPLFDPPVHWGRLYPPLARTVRKCEGLTTFPSAVELVGRFLGPALDGSAAGRRWSFDLARWNPAKRFTRPRIGERNVRVVEDTFGVRSQSTESPQEVHKPLSDRLARHRQRHRILGGYTLGTHPSRKRPMSVNVV